MKKYQELEQKIQELQQEVDRLKKEEQENQLPDGFKIKQTLTLLQDTSKLDLLLQSFTWNDTPQGHLYWSAIFNHIRKLSDKDIIQLQKWVILYYQQQAK
jgi:hypothetical protein